MMDRPSTLTGGHERIRVLLVISNLEFGGAQRQVIELANHLDGELHDVHICSLSEYVPLADDLRDRTRRLHFIPKRHKFDITTPLRLSQLLRDLKTDVVHGFLFDAMIASRLAGHLARTQLVVGSERNTDYTLKWRHLLAYRMTRSCVDLVIANSHAGAAFNRNLLKHPQSQYGVVHNGVNTDRFRPADGSSVRREIGLRPDDFVVGMFASYKRQKNHPLFLAAARRVFERTKNARFMLVGDALHGGLQGTNALKRAAIDLARNLGIEGRCLFINNRPDPERLYTACDVTVLPSIREGTPNVLLESMACGVPVVATDISDNSQIVPDGQVGYVVPLGDEAKLAERICDLILNPQLRRRMGQAARRWVEQEFSLARLAAKTADLYRQGLQDKAGSACARNR